MIHFAQVKSPPDGLRFAYLESLAEPQEWFLEELVQGGQTWNIPSVAYGVISGRKLVEFFVEKNNLDKASLLFAALQQQTGFTTLLAKSFDHQVLQITDELNWPATERGYLFRKHTPRPFPAVRGTDWRRGNRSDLPAVWEMNDGFFGSRDELAALIGAGNLWVLKLDCCVIGCGVAIRVIADRDAVDVGMLISPDQRGRGYGTYVVARLAEQIVKAGLRPICGCADHNHASRAALQKAGFEWQYRLVQVDLPQNFEAGGFQSATAS